MQLLPSGRHGYPWLSFGTTLPTIQPLDVLPSKCCMGMMLPLQLPQCCPLILTTVELLTERAAHTELL